MKMGSLRHKITIQEKQSLSDSYGQPTETWVGFATIWANVNIGSGREFFAAKQSNAELSGIIKIRYIQGINSAMRVMYGERIFDIIAPPINIGEKNREIELHVKEVI